jgi:predicted dehydrogenase
MEDKKIGIGVVGAGNRITRLLRDLKNISNLSKIVGVYDPSKEAVSKFQREFGDNIKIYDNYVDLINSSDVKWVMIGSYNPFHKDQVLLAMKAGKGIFCEKPLAVTLNDCKKIKTAYTNSNLQFLISYPLRYVSHYMRIKKLIDSNEIGDIISLEFNEILNFEHGSAIMGNWRRDEGLSGGHLLEKCCHDFDIVNSLVGSLPQKVASFGGLNMFKKKNNKLFKYVKLKEYFVRNKNPINPFLSNKSVVDNQVVIMEYRNRVRATFHTNISSSIPERRLYICGTEGTIRSDIVKGKIEVDYIDPDKHKKSFSDNSPKESHWGGDITLMKSFDSAMRTGSIPIVSFDDAIKSAVTTIMVDKARKEGEVIDLTKTWKSFGYI